MISCSLFSNIRILTRPKFSRPQPLATITLYTGFSISKRLSEGSSIYGLKSPLMWLSTQPSLGSQGWLIFLGVLCMLMHIGSSFTGGTIQNTAQETSSSTGSSQVPAGMGRLWCSPLASECHFWVHYPASGARITRMPSSCECSKSSTSQLLA